MRDLIEALGDQIPTILVKEVPRVVAGSLSASPKDVAAAAKVSATSRASLTRPLASKESALRSAKNEAEKSSKASALFGKGRKVVALVQWGDGTWSALIDVE